MEPSHTRQSLDAREDVSSIGSILRKGLNSTSFNKNVHIYFSADKPFLE